MKHSLLLFLLITTLSTAQSIPKLVVNDSTDLKLSKVKIDVEIIGNYATTTYDLQFFNNTNETLEGELAFPLAEGQTVTRFALDIRGKLREAVVVEKELARVAFESTVRQNIDPALLEKTEGNNYKARVYPINSKQFKRVIVSYEEILNKNVSDLKYSLPLAFNTKLDSFNLNISVYGKNDEPKISNSLFKDLRFKNQNLNYTASISKQNVNPNKTLNILIPIKKQNQVALSYKDYFIINPQINATPKLKNKPSSITILWDASYSMRIRDLDAELNLLDSYLEYLGNVSLEIIVFSNTFNERREFNIKNGRTNNFKSYIKTIKYDGATSLSSLDDVHLNSSEILLFSDGLINFGESERDFNQTIYTINSLTSANFESLKSLASKNSGHFINLKNESISSALDLLKNTPLKFLGISNNSNLIETLPKKNTPIFSNFTFTGRFSKDTRATLLFGYQNTIIKRIPITIKKSQDLPLVKRLWAKEKVKSLLNNRKVNKEKIIDLAVQNSLITDYTSLIVLDRIEDYVRYKIEPPKELKSEYKSRIAEIKNDEKDFNAKIRKRKKNIFSEYDDINFWHATKFPKKGALIKSNPSVESEELEETEPGQLLDNQNLVENQANPSNNVQANLDLSKRTISGVIKDENGLPLPGVTIIIKGTRVGTQTDFDGNYIINAEQGDELVISYIGYSTKNHTVANLNTIDISLDEPSEHLDEVVVTAMGVERNNSQVSTSTQTIVSENLNGKVSGLDINSNKPSRISIRGNRSISSNNEALIILDGEIVNSDKISQLDPSIINSVDVIKGADGAALYGSRGTNGLIIISTNNGMQNKSKAIQDLDDNIKDKVKIKAWNPKMPYIETLKNSASIEEAYNAYLKLRISHTNQPSFFLDVSDFFKEHNKKEISLRILSNLLELELDNYELLKAVGYKLEEIDEYKLSIIPFKKVLELRPEDPQSYRDLALAYQNAGY
ncbi:VIT domain-containing protein, partial [Croceibacter atlanticus]